MNDGVRDPKDFVRNPDVCLSFKGPCGRPTQVWFHSPGPSPSLWSTCGACAEDWRKEVERKDARWREVSYEEWIVLTVLMA